MTIHEAAQSLYTQLRQYPWFVTVGIGVENGRDTIMVYVSSFKEKEIEFFRNGWNGHPVVIRRSGFPKATDSLHRMTQWPWL